jgi:hypothetical protein
MVTGTVNRLWRWPVKSMAGEEQRALSLGPRGVGGDRSHAVLHHHKGDWRPLTAREAPRLLAWRAAYPFNLDGGLDPGSPPHALVTEPDGLRSWRWGDPRLRAALERDLGRELRLEREIAGIPDVPGTVLLTVAGSLASLSQELATDVDARRFRPNLHLELGAEPWAELAWAGAEVELEDGVRLRIEAACERCAIPTRDPDTQEKWPDLLRHLTAEHGQGFGVRARVITPGRVRAGEQVRIETS